MRLSGALAILLTLTAGCTTGRVTSDCPDLPPPPRAAVTALGAANDPVVDQWAVDLAKHYDKLDVCLGGRNYLAHEHNR